MSRRTLAPHLGRLLPLLLLASACVSWKPVAIASPELQHAEVTTRYRVTTVAGVEWSLTQVHFRNDSLHGTWNDNQEWKEMGFLTTEVQRIQVQKFSAANTVAAVAVGVAVVAVIALGNLDNRPKYTPPPQPISCPLIYSWDGHKWRLDSGTFGGAITPALARIDMDNLIHARPVNGLLQFRMTAEADETEHVDAVTVLAVDHPTGTTVAPDARANMTFHVVGALQAPIAARDRMRPDILRQVATQDALYWEPRLDGRDPANPEHLRDGVEVTFARPSTPKVQLVVDAQNTEWAAQLMGEMVAAHGRLTAAWYNPTTSSMASAPVAKAQREEGFLSVEIWNGSGWTHVGEIWEAGPEVAKRQVLPLDLTDIPGDVVRLRLESAPAMWMIDYVGLGPQVNLPVTTHTLSMTQVRSVKFADARSRLTEKDGVFLDMERGDTVEFAVRDAAPVARGMTRSYLLQSSGWYQVHGRDQLDPIAATLTTLSQPHGAARAAVTRLNEALAALTSEAQRVGQH